MEASARPLGHPTNYSSVLHGAPSLHTTADHGLAMLRELDESHPELQQGARSSSPTHTNSLQQLTHPHPLAEAAHSPTRCSMSPIHSLQHSPPMLLQQFNHPHSHPQRTTLAARRGHSHTSTCLSHTVLRCAASAPRCHPPCSSLAVR